MGNNLIDRQAAIDALTHKWDGMVTSVFDVINSLPSAQPDVPDTNVGDMISRQTAIEELDRGAWGVEWDKALAKAMLESLPSAQPDLNSAYTEGYTQAEAKYRAMWDEMQANIKEKAFGKRKGLVHTADIDAMPTIEERKTGKWVRHYSRPNVYADLCWHCSNCGYKTPDNWANKWKFCPNCGARMVQEGEDNE